MADRQAPEQPPEPTPDHYAVLGVQPTASPRQITAAFRRLVRALHPDTNPDRTTTADGRRLAEVMNAYGTLHDPVRRAAYDAHRTRGTQPGPEPGGRPIPVRVRVRRTPAPRTPDLRVSSPYAAEPDRIWDLLWQWTNRW